MKLAEPYKINIFNIENNEMPGCNNSPGVVQSNSHYEENAFRKKRPSKSSNTLVKDSQNGEKEHEKAKMLPLKRKESRIGSCSDEHLKQLRVKNFDFRGSKEHSPVFFVRNSVSNIRNNMTVNQSINNEKTEIPTSRTTFNTPQKRWSARSVTSYMDKMDKKEKRGVEGNNPSLVKITQQMSKKFRNLNNENLKNILCVNGMEEDTIFKSTNSIAISGTIEELNKSSTNISQIQDHSPNSGKNSNRMQKRNTTGNFKINKKQLSDTLLPKIEHDNQSITIFKERNSVSKCKTCTLKNEINISHSPKPKISKSQTKKSDMLPKERFNNLKKQIMTHNVKVQGLLGDLKKREKLNQDLLKVYVTNLKIKKIKQWKGIVED